MSFPDRVIFQAQSPIGIISSVIHRGFLRLCVVGGGGNVSSPSGPIDVDVVTNLVGVVGVLRLDPEGVGTEVITLSLEEVGREVLGAVTVVEGEGSAESGSGNTPESTLGNNADRKLVCGFFERSNVYSTLR